MAEIEIIGTLGEVQQSFSAFSQGVNTLTQTYIAPNIEALNNFNTALKNIKETAKYFKTKPIDGDAIVKSLPKFNKETRDKFKGLAEITKPFEKLTKALQGLGEMQSKAQTAAESMGRMVEHFEKIKKFALEINTSQKELNPENSGGTFKANADMTVFKSVGLLLETINSSVTNESLAKFKATADSLRTFTASLVNMITINKNFRQGLQAFMQNFTEAITDKDLREGNFQNTPFDKLGKLIQGFVNTFGLTGIKDIFDTITILSSDLKGFNGKDVEEGLRAVDAAGTKIAEFIEKLSKFGVRPEGNTTTETTLHKDGSVTEKFIPTLNSHVTAVKDILSTLSTLANDLKKLGEGETIRAGLNNIEKARTNINTFIESLGSLGKRKEKTINKDGKNETVFVLNDKIQGVNIVLDALKILTGDLQSLSSNTDNALAALDLVKTELPKFIEGLGEFASLYTLTEPQEDGSVNKEYYFSNDKLRAFKALVEAMQPLTAVLSKLNVPDNFKAKVKKVGEAIRELATSFAPEKQEEGNALAFGVDNIKIIASALNAYGTAISKISLPKEALGDTGTIKLTAQNIYDLLDAFRTMDVQAGLDNMTAVSSVLAKYAGVLKSMSKIGAIDFSQIQTAFTEFMTAINTLASSNSLKQLDDKDAERFGAIGRALKGISSFLNSVFKGGDFSGFTNNIQTAIPAITDFINAMSRLTQLSTFPDFERVAKAVGSFNGKLHDATKTIEHSSRAMTKLKSILRQVYTAFVGGAVVYSIVRGIKDAIKSMYDLEYAMARVNTIARVSKSTLTDMTHQVQEMSAQFGVESSKVSKALYDINSATIKGAASMKILAQSMALAVAGFTDVEKVSDLIAKAVNAYEYNVNEAAKVSDILFVTVERGINPMEELSEYFGRLFTVSANAGVSLEETAAGLATLTARGYQTNVASTALNSAILKLSTGTKELNKLFKEYGYASSASALRSMGLAGAIQILNKATGGATEKLHDLGFNYRDIRAATTLASGAISEYNKTLELMNDKNYTANKTSEALAKVQDTVKYKFDQLKQTYVVFVQSISEYLNKNEAIKTFLTTLTEGIANVTKAMRGMTLSFSDQFKAGIATLIPKLIIALALLNKAPINKIFGGILGGVALTKAGFNSMKDSITSTAQKMRGASDELLIMSDASSSAKISVEGTTRSLETGFASAKASITSTTAEINTLVSAINKVPVAMADVNAAMKSLNFTPAAMYNRKNLMVNPLDSGVLKNLNTSLVGYGQIPTVNGFTVNPSGYNPIANVTKMATKPFGGLQVDPAYYYGHSGLGAFSERGIAAGFGTTFVTKNPNAQNWSPFSASIQATTKDIGKLDVNTSNLSNTLNYSLNKVTTKFNDFNSGANNLAKNLDVVKNISNDVNVSLNSTFKANKGVFTPLAYSQVTPNIKPFSGTDILKNEWQSTNLSVAPNGTSGGGVITVNALKTGVDAVEEAGQKAGEEVVKFSDKLKAFGKTAGGAIQKFSAMYLQMAAINGLVGLLGDITTLKNSELSFKEILDLMFNLRSALAFLPTAAGKFVDILTFGLTNLGERISQELNPADYVDEEAVRKSRGYVGSKEQVNRAELMAFKSAVVSIIKPFKELKENATTLGISEHDIVEKYSEVNKQIDAEAKKRGISQEDLTLAHKAVDKVRDSLQDYNDILNSLMPNTQALNDVFESARKAIESNSEKHAGEMEKTLGKILDVEEAIDTIVKGTGLTADQIKSGVSSVSNFEALEELIREPFVKLSKGIIEKIMPEVESAFVDLSEAGRRENLQKEYLNVVRNNVLLSSNITQAYYRMFGEVANLEKVMNKLTADESFRGEVLGLSSQFGGEAFADEINDYFEKAPSVSEMLEKPVDSIISSLSGVLNADQMKILQSKRDDIIKEWASISSSEYKTNAEFISNMIADAVSDPEIRKALDDLANNYVEVVKNTDKFRKSLVKLGTEIQQLEAQNISVKDIIGNAFGLTSVAELKDSLKFALYDPKVLDKMKLEGEDVNGAVDNYAMIVADGLKKNLSLDNILDSLDEALSKDKTFENMDASERRKKGKLFFDRVKGMVEFTTETANSMAELDYTKFMNKMRFGGDISAFQQYKQIDSKRISSLMEREVIDGLKFADAFAEFNQNVQDSDYTSALTKFSTEHKGGLEIFLNMVKQLEGIFNGSASSLQTEYKNFNKKAESFVEKYRDSLLTPIQKFEKVDDELNMQLKMLEMQAEQGNVSPELLNNTLENMEELQKLNEEVMNMKVPSSITASEAVKTGSKEAFDMVATNIFRDMYKVNVQQSNYQKDMVNKLEQLVKKSDSSLQIVGYGG